MSTAEDKAYEEASLLAHNNYRALHGVPPLKLNPKLTEHAQKWAKVCLSRNIMEHSDSDYGENIYSSKHSPPIVISPERPVQSWYEEIKDYDFDKSKFDRKTGHFTQLIWKDTTEMGVGVASRDGTVFVVANYYKPGNVVSQFEQNVPRLLSETPSAKPPPAKVPPQEVPTAPTVPAKPKAIPAKAHPAKAIPLPPPTAKPRAIPAKAPPGKAIPLPPPTTKPRAIPSIKAPPGKATPLPPPTTKPRAIPTIKAPPAKAIPLPPPTTKPRAIPTIKAPPAKAIPLPPPTTKPRAIPTIKAPPAKAIPLPPPTTKPRAIPTIKAPPAKAIPLPPPTTKPRAIPTIKAPPAKAIPLPPPTTKPKAIPTIKAPPAKANTLHPPAQNATLSPTTSKRAMPLKPPSLLDTVQPGKQPNSVFAPTSQKLIPPLPISIPKHTKIKYIPPIIGLMPKHKQAHLKSPEAAFTGARPIMQRLLPRPPDRLRPIFKPLQTVARNIAVSRALTGQSRGSVRFELTTTTPTRPDLRHMRSGQTVSRPAHLAPPSVTQTTSPPRRTRANAPIPPSTGVQPGQPKTGQPKPGQSKSGKSKTGQSKTGQPKTGETKTSETKAGETKTGETKTVQPKTGQSKAGQPKTGQPKTGQPTTGQTKTGETKSGQPKSSETKAGEPKTGPARPSNVAQQQRSSYRPSSNLGTSQVTQTTTRTIQSQTPPIKPSLPKPVSVKWLLIKVPQKMTKGMQYPIQAGLLNRKQFRANQKADPKTSQGQGTPNQARPDQGRQSGSQVKPSASFGTSMKSSLKGSKARGSIGQRKPTQAPISYPALPNRIVVRAVHAIAQYQNTRPNQQQVGAHTRVPHQGRTQDQPVPYEAAHANRNARSSLSRSRGSMGQPKPKPVPPNLVNRIKVKKHNLSKF